MRTVIFISVFLFTAQASAAEPVRCGTDAFGNTVCMDKDGVLTNSPNKAAVDRLTNKADGGSAPAGAGNNAGRDDAGKRVRCGTDQFGNTVCANY